MKKLVSQLFPFFCCFVVFLLFTFNIETISQLTGINHKTLQRQKLISKQLRVASDSHIKPCQSTNRFITFRDINDIGSGLLHKFDDFLWACDVAIRTDRTLVDYAPRLTGKHLGEEFLSAASTGKGLEQPTGGKHKGMSEAEMTIRRKFMPGWKIGHFFNISQMIYTLEYANVSYV